MQEEIDATKAAFLGMMTAVNILHSACKENCFPTDVQ